MPDCSNCENCDEGAYQAHLVDLLKRRANRTISREEVVRHFPFGDSDG